MPFIIAKTVTYVSSLTVTYVTTLYIAAARQVTNVRVSLNGTMSGMVRIRRNWCNPWGGSARAAASRPYNGWCKCKKVQFTTLL